MKVKQPTKEELVIEVAKVRQSHADWVSGDSTRRKEFARAFGWNKPKKHFDYGETELYEPTWTEIFVECGKLLSARNFTDFEGNVSELEVKVEGIERALKNNFTKKEEPTLQ